MTLPEMFAFLLQFQVLNPQGRPIHLSTLVTVMMKSRQKANTTMTVLVLVMHCILMRLPEVIESTE